MSVGGSSGAATTPAGATPARAGRLADDRAAARPDAAAVGQLLRRDARQGSRRPLRRRRHDRGRRGRGAPARSPRCSASTPQVVDGSGLSEADRTSPYQVADLLVELASTPTGAVLRDSLAVAGRSRHARAAHARHAPRRGAARARPARSPASRTSSATASRRTGTCSRSRSSPTGSRPQPPTPSRTGWRSRSPPTERAAPAVQQPASSTATPSRSAFSSFEPGLSPATR